MNKGDLKAILYYNEGKIELNRRGTNEMPILRVS